MLGSLEMFFYVYSYDVFIMCILFFNDVEESNGNTGDRLICYECRIMGAVSCHCIGVIPLIIETFKEILGLRATSCCCFVEISCSLLFGEGMSLEVFIAFTASSDERSRRLVVFGGNQRIHAFQSYGLMTLESSSVMKTIFISLYHSLSRFFSPSSLFYFSSIHCH